MLDREMSRDHCAGLNPAAYRQSSQPASINQRYRHTAFSGTMENGSGASGMSLRRNAEDEVAFVLCYTGYRVVPSERSDKSQPEGMLLLYEFRKQTRADTDGCQDFQPCVRLEGVLLHYGL